MSMSALVGENALFHCTGSGITIVWIVDGKPLPAIGGHGENFPYTSSIFSVYVVVEIMRG